MFQADADIEVEVMVLNNYHEITEVFGVCRLLEGYLAAQSKKLS